MPEYITARCGKFIGPGDRKMEIDGKYYCGCLDCMDEIFTEKSTVHEYDPEGDKADLEYDSQREMEVIDRYTDQELDFKNDIYREPVNLDIFREEGEEG